MDGEIRWYDWFWIVPLGILMGLFLPAAPVIALFIASHSGSSRQSTRGFAIPQVLDLRGASPEGGKEGNMKIVVMLIAVIMVGCLVNFNCQDEHNEKLDGPPTMYVMANELLANVNC